MSRRYSQVELEDAATMKDALNVVFKSLKKDYGFQLARQRFLCCVSCACADIAQRSEDRVNAGKPPITKWAFYHRQDANDMGHGVHIGYGDTVDEGQAIVDAALAAGLVVSWDGDIHTRPFLMTPAAAERWVNEGLRRARECERDLADIIARGGTTHRYSIDDNAWGDYPVDVDAYRRSIDKLKNRAATLSYPPDPVAQDFDYAVS